MTHTGQFLEHLMITEGLKQKELAERLQMDPKIISTMVSGVKPPTYRLTNLRRMVEKISARKEDRTAFLQAVLQDLMAEIDPKGKTGVEIHLEDDFAPQAKEETPKYLTEAFEKDKTLIKFQKALRPLPKGVVDDLLLMTEHLDGDANLRRMVHGLAEMLRK